MRKILFILLVAISIISCDTRKPIVIKEATDWTISVSLEDTYNGYVLNGITNLPDSTILSFDFIKDGHIRGQGKTEVKYGAFSIDFGEKLIGYNSIHLNCIKNNIVQKSDNILKQLELIITSSGKIEKKIQLDQLKRNYFDNIFSYEKPKDVNYSKVMNINDKPLINVNRSQVDIVIKNKLDSIELIKHMKHHLINQLVNNTLSKTVSIRCFNEGESILFAECVFAPNGKWLDAGEKMRFQDYTLVIK